MAADVSVQVEIIAGATSLLMVVVTRLLDYYLPPPHQRPPHAEPDPTHMIETGQAAPPQPLPQPPPEPPPEGEP